MLSGGALTDRQVPVQGRNVGQDFSVENVQKEYEKRRAEMERDFFAMSQKHRVDVGVDMKKVVDEINGDENVVENLTKFGDNFMKIREYMKEFNEDIDNIEKIIKDTKEQRDAVANANSKLSKDIYDKIKGKKYLKDTEPFLSNFFDCKKINDVIIELESYKNQKMEDMKVVSAKYNDAIKKVKNIFNNELTDSLKGIFKSECPICYDKSVEVCINPCGHTFCKECASKITVCAICRGSIRSQIKIISSATEGNNETTSSSVLPRGLNGFRDRPVGSYIYSIINE